MKNNLKIVTFYTHNYEHYRDKWVSSVEKYGYEYECCKRDDKGNWKLNVLQKAPFMLEMLLKYPEYDILWIDIDGYVNGELELFDEISEQGYDIATRTYKVPSEVRRRPSYRRHHNRNYYRDRSMCSAVVWIRNNDKMIEMLDLAMTKAMDMPICWAGNEDNMNWAVYQVSKNHEIKYYDLSVEYCYLPVLVRHSKEAEYGVPIEQARIIQNVSDMRYKKGKRDGIFV